MPTPRRTAEWALAAGLGALTVTGYAPFGFYPLPLLTFAGLFLLWQRAADARAAALTGFAFGLGWFVAGVSWVYVSLHTFGAMPAPLGGAVTLLFCAYLALHPAIIGYLSRRFTLSPALHWIVFVPAAFTLIEWLRSWLFTGFPWLNPGYSQAPASPLAGYAPILGLHGVTLLLIATAGALSLIRFAALRSRLRSVRPWLAALMLIWITGAALKTVAWTEATGTRVTVSLLQGNIEQDLKWREDHLRSTLETYLHMVRASDARLIILPETALPLFLRDVPAEYLDALAAHGRRNNGDVLLGIPERLPQGDYYNSVVSLGSADSQTYRKQHLVPFGEFVPPGFAWLLAMANIPMSDFTPGAKGQAPLNIAGQKVAVNICYEDAFGEEIIRALPEATLLVNLSNVAWFGDSLAPAQHLQIARMRALESGRMMLRATNTGMTAIVGVDGDIQAVLPPFVQDALVGEVRGYAGTTPFVRWGNWPVVCGALLLIALCARRRPRSM